MKKLIFGLFTFLLLIQAGVCQSYKEILPSGVNTLRAPAFPLVTIDPYTSIWSFTDKLYEENVRLGVATSGVGERLRLT